MGTKTVATRTTAIVGAGTVVTHSVVSGITPGPSYSLHDCADPGQAEIWNCIWPINLASPDGKKFVNGLTVHHRNPADAGTVSVTTV